MNINLNLEGAALSAFLGQLTQAGYKVDLTVTPNGAAAVGADSPGPRALGADVARPATEAIEHREPVAPVIVRGARKATRKASGPTRRAKAYFNTKKVEGAKLAERQTQVVRTLAKHPGVGRTELEKRSGIGHGPISSTLHWLVEHGFVISKDAQKVLDQERTKAAVTGAAKSVAKAARPVKSRGMDDAQKRAVSRRMKKYWAGKREETEARSRRAKAAARKRKKAQAQAPAVVAPEAPQAP